MARADKFTALARQPVYYADITNNLDLNPETGYLATLTNAQSIANSIRNLVLTNKYERMYQPSIGSKVQALLFDPNDQNTHSLIVTTLNETIGQFEPRALAVRIDVGEVIDSNQVEISITFSMVNVTQPFNFNIVLKRVR